MTQNTLTAGHQARSGNEITKLVQAGSGVLIASFVSIHLLNTWLAAFGPAAYNGFQQAVRMAYQQPLLEALLLSAIVVHVVTAVLRWQDGQARPLSPRAKWHRYSGIFLLVVMAGHIAAVRGPSWALAIYPGFHGLAFSINFAPYYFYPYYFLLAVGGFYHGLNGISVASARLGKPLRLTPRVLRVSTGCAAIASAAALAGFAGVWTDIGDVYDNDFARLALEILDGFTP
ncbi:MAG: hypothetical protein AAF529_04045 [Pseudomonadota bacterium]